MCVVVTHGLRRMLLRIEKVCMKIIKSQFLNVRKNLSLVWRILHKDLHPYKIQLTQEIMPIDYLLRRCFANWALEHLKADPEFGQKIIFSDEAHFWMNGFVNKQNCQIWGEENCIQKRLLSGMDRSYRSDDTEDAVTTDNPTTPFPTPPPNMISPRSPIPLHRQASPFPLENINARRIHYSNPQDRLRGTNGEVIYSSAKKPLSNNTLNRSGRSRHRIGGGMTSSSSATSCNSNIDNRRLSGGANSDIYHDQQQRLNNLNITNDEDQESPPEPAPPEIPPRGPSLHTTLRRRNDYMIPTTEANKTNQESQFLTTSASGAEYAVSGGGTVNPLGGSQYPARSPMTAVTTTNSKVNARWIPKKHFAEHQQKPLLTTNTWAELDWEVLPHRGYCPD
ncbi:unnamed protein product [Brassicogethes aeneus]|uniref:Uncharacterized protein n=1 Tax=Brassicogethes aeneus TaxID=1431903 RepID=A0A9P0BEA4_BRAAE|nr:unnamed protein product [Brassicogethes aeneus]